MDSRTAALTTGETDYQISIARRDENSAHEEGSIMEFTASSLHLSGGLTSPGLGLPEPARALPAVHQFQDDALEQLLRPTEGADQVGPPVPLQHAGRRLWDQSGRGQHDAGPAAAGEMRQKGECCSVHRFSQVKDHDVELSGRASSCDYCDGCSIICDHRLMCYCLRGFSKIGYQDLCKG